MSWSLFIPGALISMLAGGAVVALAARQHPSLRPWAIVVGASAAAMPLAIVLHNLVSVLIGGEEAVFFVVALVVAPIAFAVGILGAGLELARIAGRFGTGMSLLVAAAGMALFGLYVTGALVVTTVLDGNPPWQGPIEAVVLSVSLLALVGGSLSALLSVLIRRSSAVA